MQFLHNLFSTTEGEELDDLDHHLSDVSNVSLWCRYVL